MEKREQFGSRLGFVLVSAGCAVGLGNRAGDYIRAWDTKRDRQKQPGIPGLREAALFRSVEDVGVSVTVD